MTGKILDISYTGFTYEVKAEIEGLEVTFFTTHPSEEELKYHLKKQHELVKGCQRISRDYLDRYKDHIGKEFTIDNEHN